MHLGLIGYGNIARGVLAGLAPATGGAVTRVTLLVRPGRADAAAEDAARLTEGAGPEVTVVETLDDLRAGHPHLVAECAGGAALREAGPELLRAGIDVIGVSVGALADPATHDALIEAARAGEAKLILPPGAVGGIDILRALSLGGEVSVSYRGTKPPAAWRGTPAAEALDLDRLTGAETFFEGDAGQAARDFPKNANVAATLALAGAGFAATKAALVADPAAGGNLHEYTVDSGSACVAIRIENRASAGNAKTSQATIYSVLRAIANHTGPLVI